MSQPPLSRAIRNLEDQLGVRLFERTSRVVGPTRAGAVFANEVRRLLADVDFAVAEARLAGGVDEALRIGCIPFLPFEALQRFLTGLRARVPDRQPHVSHLLSLEQVDRLRRGLLDLGIFHGVEQHDGIETTPVFAGLSLTALLPLAHPLAAQERLGPDDLADETLVLMPRAAYPAVFDHMVARAERAGYHFGEIREAGGTRGRDLVLAAAEGLGIAVGPLDADDLGRASSAVASRRLDPPVAMPQIVVGWRADPPRRLRPLLGTVRALMEELRSAPGGADFSDR